MNANNHTVIGTKPRPSRAPLVLSSRSTPTATIRYTPDQCDYIETISANGKSSQIRCSIHYHRFRPHDILWAITERFMKCSMNSNLWSKCHSADSRWSITKVITNTCHAIVCHLKDYLARGHYLPTQGRLMVNLAKVVRLLAVQVVWEEHGIHHASLHLQSFHPNRGCVHKFFLQTSIPPSAFRKQCQHSPSTISAA